MDFFFNFDVHVYIYFFQTFSLDLFELRKLPNRAARKYLKMWTKFNNGRIGCVFTKFKKKT